MYMCSDVNLSFINDYQGYQSSSYDNNYIHKLEFKINCCILHEHVIHIKVYYPQEIKMKSLSSPSYHETSYVWHPN